MTVPIQFPIRDENLTTYGVVLALFTDDSEFGLELRRAPDDGSGNPDLGSTVTIAVLEPNRKIYVDEIQPTPEAYFYSVRGVRENYTASDWSPWAGAKARPIPTQLPAAPPIPDIDLNLTLDPVTGLVSFYADGEPRVRSIKWAHSLNGTWPTPSTAQDTDAAGDHEEVDFAIVPPDGQVRLIVEFYDRPGAAGRLIGTLRDQEPRPSSSIPVDCVPVLDVDGQVLRLAPNLSSTADSYLYYVRTDRAPTESETLANGVNDTAEELAVHTFTAPNEQAWVGIIPFKDYQGGGEVQGPHKIRDRTYTPQANDVPEITWRKALPSSTLGVSPDTAADPSGKEAVEFTVTDDGNGVAFWVQLHDEGSAAAPWVAATHRHTDGDAAAEATGYGSDPLVVKYTATRPAPGATRKILRFRAEDENGVFGKELVLVIDADGVPSGMFSHYYDADGTPYIVANATDADAASWRLHVEKLPFGDTSFTDPNFSDADPDEYKGANFGQPIELVNHSFGVNERLNCVGYFFNIVDTTGTNQTNATRSPKQSFSIVLGAPAIAPRVELKPSQNGGVGTLLVEIEDPFGTLVDIRFKTHSGGGTFDFADALDGSWTVDGSAPYSQTVNLVENFDSHIAVAVRYTDTDGVVKTVYYQRSFDADNKPAVAFSTALLGTELFLGWLGTEDLKAIRYATSKISLPATTAVDPGSGTLVVGSSSELISILTGIASGETGYVRARGYADVGGTGAIVTPDYTNAVQSPAGGGTDTIFPIVRPKAKQSGSSGLLALDIIDPQNRILETAFIVASGVNLTNDDPTSGQWSRDTVSPFTTTSSVALAEERSSFIGWAVGFNDGTGTEYWQGVAEYDSDKISHVRSVNARVNVDTGELSSSVKIDEDSQSFRIKASTSGFLDPTTVGGTVVNLTQASESDIGTLITLASGEKGFISVAAFPSTNATGTPGPVFEIESDIYRPVGGESGLWVVPSFSNWRWNSPAVPATYSANIHVAVGTDTRSVRFEHNGHNYVLDISSDQSQELTEDGFVLKQYPFSQAAFPLTVRAYPQTGGAGTPSVARVITVPSVAAAGTSLPFSGSSGSGEGEFLEDSALLDVVLVGSNVQIVTKDATADNGTRSGTWTPNWNNGQYSRKVSLSGDLTIAAPPDLPLGRTMTIKVTTNGHLLFLGSTVFAPKGSGANLTGLVSLIFENNDGVIMCYPANDLSSAGL